MFSNGGDLSCIQREELLTRHIFAKHPLDELLEALVEHRETFFRISTPEFTIKER